MGGGGHPGVSSVFQGGNTCITYVPVGLLVAARCDDADGGRLPHRVLKADQWESGMAAGRQDIGDTVNVEGLKGCGDEFDGQVHWPLEGSGGAVGGPTNTNVGMYKGKGLWGRGSESKVMVEAVNFRGDTVDQVVGSIMGGGDRDIGRGDGYNQQTGSKRAGERGPQGTGKCTGGQMTTEWCGFVWCGTGAS